VQHNTGLNNDDCKFRTDIKRLLENSPFIAQNFKSTFRIPSCSAQERFAHLFFYFLTQVRATKGRSIFLFSANPSFPTKKYGTFGPSVP
jgi:hypothetical protein